MYETISKYYDAMYVDDDSYRSEVEKVVALVEQHKKSEGTTTIGKSTTSTHSHAPCGTLTLLDIACGTGAQAAYLQEYFTVTGIDICDEMLEVAKRKVRNASFINADMCNFNLHNQFDVIVNLYGSIGQVESLEHMQMAMNCVSKHLKPGGIFILTPWSTKESFREALVGRAKTYELSGFCRMETVKLVSPSKIKIDYHHLISDNLDVKYYQHSNYITLFSESEYVSSILNTGMQIIKRLAPDEFRMGAFICTV